jgi:polyhydroxybutyrate depolymerase
MSCCNTLIRRALLQVLAVALVMAGMSASAPAQFARPAPPTRADLAALGFEERSIKVGATERWFLIQRPRDTSRPAPVVVLLHGGTQSMRRIFAPNAGATRAWPQIAARENAVLLVPNGTNSETGDTRSDNQTWADLRGAGIRRGSSADDVGFIAALLDWVHANVRTDRKRVYVTGASNGGMMTFRLLIEAPERFAAAAAFVSALPVENDRLSKPKMPTPLLIANGTLDPLIKWGGGPVLGSRGVTRSVPATIAWWVEAYGARREPAETAVVADRAKGASCTITMRRYAAATHAAPIVAYEFDGGGHALPSAQFRIPDNFLVRRFIGNVCTDLEGAELAWSFMARHAR